MINLNFGSALLVVAIAAAVPTVSVAAPQQRATGGRLSAADQSDIVFRSAVTIEAIQRSNDLVVRRLVAQVSTLKRQLLAGAGDRTRLKLNLSQAQNETVRRLSETDAKYAAERTAFVQAVSTLFEGGDARVEALLHRYAEGDATALAELQEYFRRSTATRPQRLLDQRALATLVVDATRKEERDTRAAIAAQEAVLRENPDDYGALLQVRGLYLISGQVDRAQTASDRIAAIERGPDFDNAPHMRAFTLGQNSLAALKSGRSEQALDFAERAVALARAIAAEKFEDWQSRHPGATEPRRVIEGYNREQLAIALNYLKDVQRARNDTDGAILSGEEVVALRRLNVEDELREHGAVTSAFAMYAASDSVALGNLLLTKGDAASAASAYRTALSLAKLGPFTKGQPRVEPYWIFTPLAGACIANGDLDEAERALGFARTGLQAAKPSAYVVAGEGHYWLRKGDLLRAKGQPTEARSAWVNAEVALGQATSLDRDNEDWRRLLADVEKRLALPS